MKQLTHIMKLISVFFISIMFTVSSSMAADKALWKSASGTVWMDGDGDCWASNMAGDMSACGGSPAPMMEEESGYFWPDDSDFDGVVDGKDLCLFTPEGVAVDSNGCALDEDNDGVPDYLDQCKGTPAGTRVDLTGCPVLFNLTGILFETNSARLTAADKTLIDQALPTINSSSAMLDIVGHTDSRGSSEYNQGLSERRAASVKAYLVSKGVSANRLNAYGRGESRPVASNDTSDGRAQNRRVEISAR